MFNLEQGKKLVQIARNSVEKFFEKGRLRIKKVEDEEFTQKLGVFVTIETWPTESLRGCIGFPYPEYPLYEAVQRAAVDAAFNDPRFPPLGKNELNNVTFEISILSTPKEIKIRKPLEILEKLEPFNGVILEVGWRKALFLPQVWKQLPNKEDFLSNLCMKAGLPPDCWMDEKTKFYSFRVQAFKEVKPYGEVVEVKLNRT